MRDLNKPVPAGYLPTATYLRKSVVKEDKDAESIDVQRSRNDAYAETRNWTITVEYVDEGRSGADAMRPDWRQLVDDIESGKVKRLVVREQARLVRDDFELLKFLQVVKATGLEVFDSYGRPIINNMETKLRGLMDADYREQISKAVTAKRAHNAELGKPPAGGNRPYGYTHNYAELVSEEVKVLKDMAKRYLAGESLYSIAKDYNARGVFKYSGKPWKSDDISKFLGRAEYAGIRSYKGDEVAVGQWVPLWDKDQVKAEAYYRKLRVKLDSTDPWSRDTARKHLLVGVLYCGLCDRPLACKSPSYWCSPAKGGCGKIVRNKPALEDYMLRRAYEELLQMPTIEVDEQEDPIAVELDRLQAEIDEALAAKNAGDITLKEFISMRSALQAQMGPLHRQQSRRAPLPVSDAQAFLDASTDKQRATIKRLHPVVSVMPTGKKGTRFNPDQLVFP